MSQSALSHPYSPSTISLPNYVPNTISSTQLLFRFILIIAAILLPSWAVFARGRNLSKPDILTFLWLVLCAYLHLIFESYVLLTHALHALDPLAYPPLQSLQSLYAQFWKEYGLSDSRYILPLARFKGHGNLFLWTIETLTIFILGPLCMYTAWLITERRAGRWIGQIVISVMHFYGCLLYYGTGDVFGFGGDKWYSVESGLYYWGYFVVGNAPWVMVPILIIYRAGRQVVRAVEMTERLDAEWGKKIQ